MSHTGVFLRHHSLFFRYQPKCFLMYGLWIEVSENHITALFNSAIKSTSWIDVTHDCSMSFHQNHSSLSDTWNSFTCFQISYTVLMSFSSIFLIIIVGSLIKYYYILLPWYNLNCNEINLILLNIRKYFYFTVERI